MSNTQFLLNTRHPPQESRVLGFPKCVDQRRAILGAGVGYLEILYFRSFIMTKAEMDRIRVQLVSEPRKPNPALLAALKNLQAEWLRVRR